MNFIAIPFHRFLQAACNLVCAFASTVLVRLQTTTTTVLTATLLLVVDRDLGKSTASTAGNGNSNQQQSDPPSSLYRLASATGVASLMSSPSSCRRGSVEARLDSPPEPLQPEAALALREESCVPKPDETTATTTTSASNGEDCGSNTDTGATAGANSKGDDKNAPDSKRAAPPPPTVIHLPLRAERRISRDTRLSARLRKRCSTSESPGCPGTTTTTATAGAKRSWEDHSDLTDTDDNQHQKVDTTGRECDPFTNHPACLRTPKKTRWALRFVARNRERSRADRSRRRAGILASSPDSYGKEQKFRRFVLWAHTVGVGAAAVVVPASDDPSVSTKNSTAKNARESVPSRTDR